MWRYLNFSPSILVFKNYYLLLFRKNLLLTIHLTLNKQQEVLKKAGTVTGVCVPGIAMILIWKGELCTTNTHSAGQGTISLHGRGGFRITLCPQMPYIILGYIIDIPSVFQQISPELTSFLSFSERHTHSHAHTLNRKLF